MIKIEANVILFNLLSERSLVTFHELNEIRKRAEEIFRQHYVYVDVSHKSILSMLCHHNEDALFEYALNNSSVAMGVKRTDKCNLQSVMELRDAYNNQLPDVIRGKLLELLAI